MKMLLLIGLLGTLAACKTETSSRSCTLNGQPVSCEAYSTGPANGAPTAGQPFVLTASAQSDITFNNDNVEVKSDSEQNKVTTLNGKEYRCYTSLKAGSTSSYSITNKKLTLTYPVETRSGTEYKSEKYELLEGNGDELFGTWIKKNVKFANGFMNLILKFDDRSLTSVVECHFR